MILKNKELENMLRKQGRDYTLNMYANRYIHLTDLQLQRVLSFKDRRKKNEKSRIRH